MKTTQQESTNPGRDAPNVQREVWNKGFCSLMVMQFAGAMNDNILRSLISVSVAIGGIWAATKVGSTVGTPIVGLCLTVPFLIFSGWGGQIADRYSKRTLMIILKAVETPCAFLALFAFAFESVNLALLTLILIATQSAFYGPVKYGVIAELVDRRRLGPANGWISMSTQIAIVIGSLIGAVASELYAPQGMDYDLVWVPGMFIIFFALLGLVPTFFIPRLIAKDPGLRVGWNPFATYIPSLRDMAKGPILGVVFAWAGFWLIGMISLSALPDLQKALAPAGEALSPVRAIALVSVLGLFSGIGSALCGWLSRDGVKAIHVPLGAAGMTVFFFLIGIVPVHFWLLAGLAAGGGFCAGFYLIPLWTLIQARAPEAERGRYLGTANAISFAFMTVGAILYAVWTKVFGLGVSEVFLLNAGLAFIGCLIFLIRRHRLAGWVQDV
jgi:MFS family permease